MPDAAKAAGIRAIVGTGAGAYPSGLSCLQKLTFLA